MSWKTLAVKCTTNALHLYNRGVNGMAIFRSDADYAYWTELMVEMLPKYQIEILLYSLMPNHWHISSIQQKAYEISCYLHDVCSRYARFFNKKYRRYGPLFAGRFHPQIVQDDVGLLRLSYYIHMNPVAAGLVADPSQWQYSSCSEYLEAGKGELIRKGSVLGLVGGVEEYRSFLKNYNPGDPFSANLFMKNGKQASQQPVLLAPDGDLLSTC